MDTVNKHAQGSIWYWNGYGNSERYDKGVQQNARPVLIVSNNTFNNHSPCVNCVTITSVLKDSPVHILIDLDVESHIQCEQLHTISKQNLINYKGTVTDTVFADVKRKLKFQLNIRDRDSDMLSELNSKITDIAEEIRHGFKNAEKDGYIINIMSEFLLSMSAIKNDISALVSRNTSPASAGSNDITDGDSLDVSETVPETQPSQEGKEAVATEKRRYKPKKETEKREKAKHHSYAPDEIEFVLNKENSAQDVKDMFGLTDIKAAYRLRAYINRRHGKKEGL